MKQNNKGRFHSKSMASSYDQNVSVNGTWI
jgi:hypothetical protein